MESLSKLIEISATYKEIANKFIELNNELVFRSEKAEEQVRGLIAANKTMTEELEKVTFELAESVQLSKELNLFISILAHDLKSPFTVLLNLSDLLSESVHKKPLNEIEKHTRLLNQSAHKANNLLNEILRWIINTNNPIPLDLQNLSLFQTFESTFETLKQLAGDKKIEVSNQLNNANVVSDPEVIKAILRNLLSNAIKFTPIDGTIKITSEENEKEVIVTVADNGVGMDDEKLKCLFNISKIKSTPGTDKEPGTGLGLIICKQFVDRIGGKLWVESEYHKGSQFHFSIPKQINPQISDRA